MSGNASELGVFSALPTEQNNKSTTWNDLALEIRLQIWQCMYAATPGRIVELRTAEHDHDNSTHESGFCPRYSPSPLPIVFNICQESRKEARRLAVKEGHILFPSNTASGTNSPLPDQVIYFNPSIDTVYIHIKKHPVLAGLDPFKGILRQILDSPQHALIRSLAFALDLPVRVATFVVVMDWQIRSFAGLAEVLFVANDFGEEELHRFVEVSGTLGEAVNDIRGPWPLRLAKRSGAGFEFGDSVMSKVTPSQGRSWGYPE